MTITIEHSGEGTLVHGTTRGDTAVPALKAAGFRWSRNLDAWYLNSTWSYATRTARVNQVKAQLGDQVGVELGDAAKPTTADERVEQMHQRAEQRADRQLGRAERLTAESDAAYARSTAITDRIPFGQPILVGHHSERRHRNDLDRSWHLLGKSVETQREADQLAQVAAGSLARVAGYDDPVKIGRRLERNRAEERKLGRQIEGTGKQIHGEHIPYPTEYNLARRAELQQDIERDERVLAGQADRVFTRADIKVGDQVRVRSSWCVVLRVNPKTVTVKTYGLTIKYLYTEIRERRTGVMQGA